MKYAYMTEQAQSLLLDYASLKKQVNEAAVDYHFVTFKLKLTMKYNNKNITYLSFLFLLLFFPVNRKKIPNKKLQLKHRHLQRLRHPMVVNLTKAQFKNAGIKFEAPSEKELPVELHLNGKVLRPPAKKISIHSPLGAYVRSLPWIQGMNVKGQLLVVL